MNTAFRPLGRAGRRVAQVALGFLMVAAALLGPAGAPVHAVTARATTSTLVVWGQGGGVPYVRNFNPCSGGYPDSAAEVAVFEPLMLTDAGHHKLHPWLATKYQWSKDLKTLTFTIRHGVRWSDGKPFTAKDVYFTLWTLAAHGCDQAGLRGPSGTARSVSMLGPNKIVIHYKQGDSTNLWPLTGIYPPVMLPEHIYSKHLDKITSWADDKPVGTGPFPRVLRFTSTSFDLGKNPYYWQKGKPMFDVLRTVGYSSDSPGNLALEAGQIDWAGSAIPNAKNQFDARNPHFHSWSYNDYADNVLFTNDAKYPLSLPAFRMALSMALDRRALDRANFGYSPPDNATATDPYPGWIDRSIPNTLAQYQPDRSRALLEKAGFTYHGASLIDPHGTPVSIDVMGGGNAVNIATVETIASEFRALGISATVTLTGALDRANVGDFDTYYYSGSGGPSPYFFYQPMLSSQTYKPVGQNVNGTNIERWKNPQMDRLFAEYRLTANKTRQKQLVFQMERLFVKYLPIVPVGQAGIPEEFNTTRFVGFPDGKNRYAAGQPFAYYADTMLILERLRPTR